MISTLSIPVLALVTGGVTHDWDLRGDQVLWQVSVVMFFVFLNGFFVAAEFALVKVRDSQLQESIDDGHSNARFARGLTKHLDAYLSATQLGITLASIALGMLGEPYISHMLQPLLFMIGLTSEVVIHNTSFVISYAVVTFLHVVFGELLPKSIAIRKSLPVTLVVARPLHWFYIVLKPAIFILNGTANWMLRVVFRIDPVSEGEHVHSGEELKHIVTESQRSEEVTETEKHIVLNALALNDRYVRDVMTPRKDVISLDMEESFEANLKVAFESKHTRFPLVEGHLDHSIGLIHIKDLIRLVHEGGKDRDMRKIKRELLLVPEMMPIDKLLKFFLDKHAHLALAVDEYGGGVGIVTLDNVLEEIVGDIQDEFDGAVKSEFHRINEEEFTVEGMLNLYELNDLTELDLESDEVTTIGGYVIGKLGHFPKLGEKLRIENYEVTATRVEARRVSQLHFKRVDKPDDYDEVDKPGKSPADAVGLG